MKTTLTIFALLLCTGFTSLAQTKNDIFDPKVPITWLGIDFSGAKIIGDRERLATQSDLVKLMESMNDLMKAEADKYNVGAALDRKNAEMALEITKEHNAALDPNEMFSEEASDHLKLTPAGVEEIIQGYDFKDHHGLGVMFNVGSFNKNEEEAILYFTIVNMDTREVLLSERYIQKPGGFSIRNYWARTIYDALEKINKKDFNAWKKRLGYK
jgi:hypothetical protein